MNKTEVEVHEVVIKLFDSLHEVFVTSIFHVISSFSATKWCIGV